jgi:hypothetical protein
MIEGSVSPWVASIQGSHSNPRSALPIAPALPLAKQGEQVLTVIMITLWNRAEPPGRADAASTSAWLGDSGMLAACSAWRWAAKVKHQREWI